MSTETSDRLRTGNTSQKLRIANSSQKFLQEVIATFPVNPVYSEIIMIAQRRLKDEEVFLAECRAKGVIPGWKTKVEFDKKKGCFVLVGFSNLSREINVYDILRGGKPYEVSVETEDLGLTGTGFNNFQEILFRQLVEEGYKIERGDIWTTNYVRGGYNWGGYKATGAFLGGETWTPDKRGLELQLEHSSGPLKPEDLDKLVSWFNSLRERYG